MLREESGRVHIGRAILFAVMGLGLLLEILVQTPPEILFNGISKAVWSLPTFRKARADAAEIERAAEEAADEQAERGTAEWKRIYMRELNARLQEHEAVSTYAQYRRDRYMSTADEERDYQERDEGDYDEVDADADEAEELDEFASD